MDVLRRRYGGSHLKQKYQFGEGFRFFYDVGNGLFGNK